MVNRVNDISSSLAEQFSANNSLFIQAEKAAQITDENSQATAEADALKELAGDIASICWSIQKLTGFCLLIILLRLVSRHISG